LEKIVVGVIVESRPRGVVSREELTGGDSPFHKGMDGVQVLHPFSPPPPKLVQSDGCAGSILYFGQIGHVWQREAPKETTRNVLAERAVRDQ
jgi:hypothetical protein